MTHDPREATPPESAAILIVGAGIVGASLAHHLAERGCVDVVLVDQGPLWKTGGSTSHAPGLVFELNPSHAVTQLAQWSVELYSGLELDGQPCWHPVGSLEVSASEERSAELDRRYGRALAYGLEAELLEPDAVQAKLPTLDPSRIRGGLYVPRDGIAKGVRIAEALGRKAIARGVRVFGNCEVTRLDVAGGRIRGVETTRGAIRADRVVLCAGIWGPKVAHSAGVRVALVPTEHLYAETGPLPELAEEQGEISQPILRHQDFSMYVRQAGRGYGIGSYRHEPRLVEPEAIAAANGRPPSELPFTHEDFAAAQGEAERIIPAMRGAELVRSFNGLMSFTPDGFPLLGESSGVRGLWLGEAIWVTHAGGAARALADLMTTGDTEVDLHECDPGRFDAHGLSRSYARARGEQQYREVYDIIHPRDPALVARGLRASPFHPRQVALDAHNFENVGWERPQWYEGNAGLVEAGDPERSAWSARNWSPIVAAEHRATREKVGLFDLTPFAKLEVSGPGALAFLQGLVANDLDRPPGTIVYTAVLTPRGGIRDDLTITRLSEDAFFLLTGGSMRQRDLAWLRRQLPTDGSVVLEDRSSGLCCLGVWGPRARDLLAAVSEDDLSNEAFPYLAARDIHLGMVPARALRISYVGELGWELYTPPEFGLALWDTLWEAGEALGAVACGGGAYDSLRLEKGYRLFGAELDEEHDPYEAGLGFAVKLAKGPFVGRDALLRAKEAGPTRRLCCLLMGDADVVLLGKEPLMDGDAVLGYVTSAGWGATVGESILYGYLPADRAEVGTTVEVYADGRRHPATVAAEPLFDPTMARLRDAAPAGVR